MNITYSGYQAMLGKCLEVVRSPPWRTELSNCRQDVFYFLKGRQQEGAPPGGMEIRRCNISCCQALPYTENS
jgi:hypothetical protein